MEAVGADPDDPATGAGEAATEDLGWVEDPAELDRPPPPRAFDDFLLWPADDDDCREAAAPRMTESRADSR